MIKTANIESLSSFQKNTKGFVARLESSREPIVLTVNGKAKLVVQDADAYQAMLDLIEDQRFMLAVRQGLSEANEESSQPSRLPSGR